jgi:phosphoadenosine phosphosulfate reductase
MIQCYELAPQNILMPDQAKIDATIGLLRAAVRDYGKVVYSSSLGAESIVLERRYNRRIRIYYPDPAALEALVAKNGINGFYNSLENRLACCHVRKVEVFSRAVKGAGAWVTGVRHEQSATRSQVSVVEFDAANGLAKISPILDWTHDDVWDYIRANKLPYNPLHDKGYPSIGCAPCTRAVEPGSDSRSGRWWWENSDSKECGLQPRAATKS